MFALAPLLLGFLPRDTPIVRAYRASSKGNGLSPAQLRRALSDVGMDVGVSRARDIVHRHGENDRMRLRHFHRFLTHEREASAARTWIALDPRGGARRSRAGFARFGASGLVTPLRFAHYSVGLASLVVGTADFGDYVVSGFAPEMSAHAATAHGALHTAAAFLSLPRFHYRSSAQRRWHGALTSSRDAGMWSSPAVFLWYTLSLDSQLVRADGRFALDDPLYVGTGAVAAFLLSYSVARAFEEDAAAEDREFTRARQAFVNLWLPVMVDVARALYLPAHGAAEYVDLVARSPDFGAVQTAMFLGAMYTGNLVCALASALHYDALDEKALHRASLATQVPYVLPPLALIWRMHDGAFPAELTATLF